LGYDFKRQRILKNTKKISWHKKWSGHGRTADYGPGLNFCNFDAETVSSAELLYVMRVVDVIVHYLCLLVFSCLTLLKENGKSCKS